MREHFDESMGALGTDLVGIIDIDGDGVEACAASAGGLGIGPGLVAVYSGRTGRRLVELRGVDGFGASLAFVDGRKRDHLVVSAPATETSLGRGCVDVYSW